MSKETKKRGWGEHSKIDGEQRLYSGGNFFKKIKTTYKIQRPIKGLVYDCKTCPRPA